MMKEMNKCFNCTKDFAVDPEDLGFYKKFGVSIPKMCPACRAQRRLSFRNERVFYKRKCDKCGKDGVAMFSPNKSYPVWCYDCWWGDDWDPRDYGREYNFDEPFFDQFQKLWNEVPKPALVSVRGVNSDYLNYAADSKNCYMIVESSNNENCIHCYWIQLSKDLVDCSFTQKVERSYESDDCYESYGLLYSKGCHSCADSAFLLNCRGCTSCIGCINLRNKSYYIFNKPYTKEEYEAKMKSFRLDTYSGVEKLRKEFEEFIKTQPRKYAEIYNTLNSTGNYMTNVKNNRECFHSYDAENNAYCVHAWREARDCMDSNTVGRTAENIYNSLNTGMEVANVICGSVCWGSQFMDYCVNSPASQHCFGCVGVRSKKYCIFNKQYGKEEYDKLRERIMGQMKEAGEYGEFFPPQLSAFGYNESSAMIELPLSKEEALEKGFKWEDYPRGTYSKETVSWDDTSDSINEIDDLDVPKEIFACLKCKKNYKIITNEFAFYKNLGIPLPRLCPDCRHERRISARGPNNLWSRQCMCDYKIYNNSVEHNHHQTGRCPNEFETSYAPEREEIIYCEECYNTEIL